MSEDQSDVTPPADGRTRSPLPFRGDVLQITFAASSVLGGGPGQTELGVYDVTGRRVTMLVRGPYEAGHHEVAWDGRDERGYRLPPGTYFLRLRSEGASRVLKVVMF